MPDPRGTLLVDELMPRWQRRIIMAKPVQASARRTFSAIRTVDFFQSPIIAVPNRFRVELDRIRGAHDVVAPMRRSEFRFAQLVEEDGGFQLLAE